MTLPISATKLLELLKPEAYQRQRYSLIRFFEWNGAQDPADLADEVFLRLVCSQTKVENLAAFIHGTAQNVLREHRREREREHAIMFEIARSAIVPAATDAFGPELDKVLTYLPEQESALLREFYRYPDDQKAAHRARLAERLGISANALRIRMTRARKRLARCLEQDHENNEINSDFVHKTTERSGGQTKEN